ncbi:MAG: F0F1 ATP synthase subunit delta [Candidatus Komeilibacteria bacterium]
MKVTDKQVAQAIMTASLDKKGKVLDGVIESAAYWLKSQRLISRWPKIRLALEQAVREAEGRVLVKVITRYPVGQEMLATISRWCHRHLGKPVDLEEVIDVTIIGGFKLMYGDQQLDATINHRLKSLHQQLLNE